MENNNEHLKVDENKDYNVDEQNKIYILGGKGVGKTTFFHLIFSGQFNSDIPESKPGIIKSNYKKGNKVFTIKDLSDDEDFNITKILKNELEDVILIFILFSLDDKDSFEYAKTLVQFIKNNLIDNKELNIILLGNKYDLGENNDEAIQVKKREADKYASTMENLFYYEISCKTSYNFATIKKLIDEIEINDGGNEEDDDKISEEERKKKVNDVKNSSCLLF